MSVRKVPSFSNLFSLNVRHSVKKIKDATGKNGAKTASVNKAFQLIGFFFSSIPPFILITNINVSLRLRVQNAVSAQPCVGKFRISLVLLNFLHCNFRLWFETP